MGHTKTSYMVRYGLGPVVQKELLKDINTENLLTLLLDETTTKQVVKQMDFLIPHWSNIENQVLPAIWIPKFFVHANAENLCNEIIDVMQENGFDLKLLFDILTDGPDINKLL